MWGYWVVSAVLVILALMMATSAFSFMRHAAITAGQPAEGGVNFSAALALYAGALCEWLQVIVLLFVLLLVQLLYWHLS